MNELEQLQTPDGADTEESRRYVRQIRSDRKKYQKNTDKIRQNLVESLYDNPQTKLLAIEFQDYDTYCQSCERHFSSIFELQHRDFKFWNGFCKQINYAICGSYEFSG